MKRVLILAAISAAPFVPILAVVMAQPTRLRPISSAVVFQLPPCADGWKRTSHSGSPNVHNFIVGGADPNFALIVTDANNAVIDVERSNQSVSFECPTLPKICSLSAVDCT